MASYKHLAPGEIPPVPTAEDFDAKFRGITAEAGGRRLWELEKQLEQMAAAMAPLSAEYEHLRKRTLPQIAEDSGVTSVVIQFTPEYRGRVGLTSDLYVQILNQSEGFDWLRDHGHGDLIKEGVHSGSLKAAMKRRIESGQGTPPSEIFKLTPFKFATITKT